MKTIEKYKRKQAIKRAIKKKQKKPNAMVVVEKTRTRHFVHIKPQLIPKDSFIQRDMNDKELWYHVLGLDLNNQFWTIARRPAEDGKSPLDFHFRVVAAASITRAFIRIKKLSIADKIKFGIFVGFAIVDLILIFLIIVSIMG